MRDAIKHPERMGPLGDQPDRPSAAPSRVPPKGQDKAAQKQADDDLTILGCSSFYRVNHILSSS